jgi:tRNA modification GTPase
MYKKDIICAIATPPGEGAISIIRLSGENTLKIVENIFRKKNNQKDVSISFSRVNIDLFKGFSLHYGFIVDSNEALIDEVMLGIYRSPHSYTGEDLVEINLHGGRLVSKRVLNLLLNIGARLADAGEFTKRSFLNGKMDLSQVEAISDIIYSKSEAALKCSLKQLSGEFGEHFRNIQKELLDANSLLELELDFLDDDVEFINRQDLLSKLVGIKRSITKMIESYEIGRLYKDGAKVTIIGKPNAGKSTILNSFLRYERAIVSDIPGTTRDFVEESVFLDGFLFRMTDTAGLRFTDDEVEKIGIGKTFEQVNQSDIILYIFDFSQDYNDWDWENFNKILKDHKKSNYSSGLIIVFNKEDLIDKEKVIQIMKERNYINSNIRIPYVFISKERATAIDELKNEIVAFIKKEDSYFTEDGVITNFRHLESLKKADEKIENGIEALKRNENPELISIHLRHALNYIGEIIGTVTTDDILNNIFSRFCIGK